MLLLFTIVWSWSEVNIWFHKWWYWTRFI